MTPRLLVGLSPLCLAIAVAVSLSSCAPVDWSRVHQTALDARREVNDVAAAVEATAPIIRAACESRREHPACKAAEVAYRTAQATITSANATIDAFHETGAAVEAVEGALEAVREVRERVESALVGLP